MTGRITYDFRNILAIIESSLRFAEKHSWEPEKVSSSVAAASDEIDRELKLTSRLFAFTKQRELPTHVGNVNEHLKALELLRPFSDGPGIRITDDWRSVAVKPARSTRCRYVGWRSVLISFDPYEFERRPIMLAEADRARLAAVQNNSNVARLLHEELARTGIVPEGRLVSGKETPAGYVGASFAGRWTGDVDPTRMDHSATILRVLHDLSHGPRRSDRLCCVGATGARRIHNDKHVRHQQ
jgi:hypothetical protein